MGKKILENVLKVLVIIGFLMVLGGVGRAGETDPGAFAQGMTVALIGLCLWATIAIGYFFYNRRQNMLPKWEQRKRRRLGLTG